MAPLRTSALLLLVACSGTGPGTIGNPSTNDAGASFEAGGDPKDSGISGPILTVRLRTSTAPVPHDDGWAGQTTRQTAQGVRTFRLLRSVGDPNPVVVFDHGSGFVEAGYDDGDDTVLGTAPLSAIPPGTYAVAQMSVTHSKFIVSSTLHYSGAAYAGDYQCVQALSDNVLLNGMVRARGWFRYAFVIGGQQYPLEGTNAPLPAQAETGGFTMKTNGGETYYELPITVVIPPALDHDATVVIHVNMHEAFRWQDQQLPGYATGVYDTTPVSYEPVMRYGANQYTLTLE